MCLGCVGYVCGTCLVCVWYALKMFRYVFGLRIGRVGVFLGCYGCRDVRACV